MKENNVFLHFLRDVSDVLFIMVLQIFKIFLAFAFPNSCLMHFVMILEDIFIIFNSFLSIPPKTLFELHSNGNKTSKLAQNAHCLFLLVL